MEAKKAESRHIKKGRVAGVINRVMISTDRGNLVPYQELKKYESGREPSQQISAQQQGWLKKRDLVYHPFRVESLLAYLENVSYFDACVRQIARDVVTPGWNIKAVDEEKENEAEKERVEAFFNDPNDRDEALSGIVEKCIVDWGAIGWVALEHSRDSKGITNGLWHVPEIGRASCRERV